MELFEKGRKFDWTNVTEDYKKMQQITALAASSGMVVATIMIFTTPLVQENLNNLLLTLSLLTVFTGLYYLTPMLYLDRRLDFLPSLVYSIGISSVMIVLGDSGDFFVIYLMLILAISAFSQTRKLYLASFLEVILGLGVVHLSLGHIMLPEYQQTILLQYYGVISFGMLLRFFATETISLRNNQEELKDRAKQLLAQKEEIYLLINNVAEGVIAVDKDKKITYINKGAIRLLGYIGNVQKFVGKDFDSIMVTAANEGVVSIADLALSKKQAVMRDDIKLIRHDKTLRIHTNTAPVIDEDRRLVGAITLFRDITAETALEEQRSEFNAIASHELRTPLTVIEGYLFYLLNNKELKYDRKTAEFIKKTYTSAEGLLQLCNDILAVTKTEQGEIRIVQEEFNLKSLVESCLDDVKSKAKDKKLRLASVIPDGLPAIVSDEQKVKEILDNLLENAIKFTDKGEVKVEIEVKTGKEVIINVKDTGLGIAKEDQSLVFHKFYRTEDWQTRKTGGTGLGLFIAKSYITRLGGKIGVVSRKGHGSRFWFSLPLTVKKKKKAEVSEKELNEFIKSI